jgi:hypothetical protein
MKIKNKLKMAKCPTCKTPYYKFHIGGLDDEDNERKDDVEIL